MSYFSVPAVRSVTSVPIQEVYVNLEDKVTDLSDPPYHSHDDVFTEEFSYADDPLLDAFPRVLKRRP